MKNDIHKTFGEIFDGDIAAFYTQFFQIKECKADRNKSKQWARQLRFLDISNVPELDTLKEGTGDLRQWTIPLTCKEDDDERMVYVAVSWRWIEADQVQADGCNTRALYEYYIKRSGEDPYKAEFPDWFMDRVIRFAQSKGIDKIWIDKACIFQRDGDKEKHPQDHQIGVQAMDLVYGDGGMAVGLLTKSLTKQHDVDLLDALLAKSIFTDSKNEDDPQLKSITDGQKILKLIRHILSDERWDRGWIFQEDHLASVRMTLLIPCSVNIIKRGYMGEIGGELKVKLARFRKTVTMFCLALSKSGGYGSSKDILDKVKQYNVCDNKTTTTLRVLDDICSRSLEHEGDRLAIFANALRFKYRLDTSQDSTLIKSDGYSMAVALLVLILMNGEIFRNNINMLHNIMSYTLRSFLEKVQCEIVSPGLKYQLSFIDHCRFANPNISHRGIETKGILWQLHSPEFLRFSEGEKRKHRRLPTERPRGFRLSERDRRAIELLAGKLCRDAQSGDLSKFLQDQVTLDVLGKKAKQSTNYILDNLYAIAQALFDGRDLYLGYPATEIYRDSEDTAIFIMPRSGSWSKKKHLRVFTSWEEDRRTDDQERLASLLVTYFHGYDRAGKQEGRLLRNCGWVNGVWIPGSGTKEKVVFPIPGFSEAYTQTVKGVKRKAQFDDDGK